ncbi:MAG: hypothetical protein CVT72_15985 [Alphaproteobacteria bacterium HGW-Alphaproteobacteria-11]|nr:MAG: hypothetical protein CVT72_15985 [Alphaproteobacteria bacterium HGW-Alphaproteobacteria-11]
MEVDLGHEAADGGALLGLLAVDGDLGEGPLGLAHEGLEAVDLLLARAGVDGVEARPGDRELVEGGVVVEGRLVEARGRDDLLFVEGGHPVDHLAGDAHLVAGRGDGAAHGALLLGAGALVGEGEAREYRYSWARQNWFANSGAEHRALREGVGLLDMSSFGKIRVEGPGALALLQRVCAGQIDVDTGRIVYCQMLNARGGIECDLTVTRLSETGFLLVVPAATLQRDLAWLRRHLGNDLAIITDVTAAEAVLCLMGPRARAVLAACSPADLSNVAHAFGTAREIELGMGLARAHRISYVGELGWELYVSTDQAAHVFEALVAAGAAEGLKLCGLHAMNSCRMEKAYRSFGHDISDEDHVLEAGLGFAVALDKPDFIGRDAVLRKREAGLTRRLVQFLLTDPGPMLYHNEPILRDGRIVGVLASGAYGHTLGGSVGLGYVPCAQPGESAAETLAAHYEIEVAGRRVAARASLAPLYDPKAERPRA